MVNFTKLSIDFNHTSSILFISVTSSSILVCCSSEANRLRMVAIACLTIEELSLIGHNKENIDHDESEDENDEEWIAPNEERNAFNLFDDLFDEA